MLIGIVSESAQCAVNCKEAQLIVSNAGLDCATSRGNRKAALDEVHEGVHNERLLTAEAVCEGRQQGVGGGLTGLGSSVKYPLFTTEFLSLAL